MTDQCSDVRLTISCVDDGLGNIRQVSVLTTWAILTAGGVAAAGPGLQAPHRLHTLQLDSRRVETAIYGLFRIAYHAHLFSWSEARLVNCCYNLCEAS
jgi:hypothetical protein